MVAFFGSRVPQSKSQLKRVLRELVRRDLINARVDVERIRELAPKKRLTAKQTPSYLFKPKGEPRYSAEAIAAAQARRDAAASVAGAKQ